MYKMIGGDGVEYGPVTAEQLKEWIAEHRANRQTLVQVEGSSEWIPLGQLTEFAEALSAAEKTWGDTTGSVEERGPAAEVTVIEPGVERLPVMELLGAGWALLVRHFGLTVGGATLVWLIITLTAFGSCIGGVVQLVISGPLYGGLAILYLKLVREQEASLKDIFSGFGSTFVPLTIVWLVSWFLSELGLAICILPGVFLKVIWAFGLVLVADRSLNFWSALELSRRTVMRQFLPVVGLLLLAYLPVVVFKVYGIFKIGTFVYENFGGVPIWHGSADIRQKFDEFVRVAATIGLQEHFVLLLNLPFATAAVVYAYEHLFKRVPAQAT